MIKEIVNSIYQISDTAFKEIEQIAEYEVFNRNVTFIDKNKYNNKEYIVLNGICKNYLINPDGEEITLSFFNEKTIVTPHTARTSNHLSLIYAKSLTKIELATLDANKFAQLMVDNIEIRNFGNQVLRNELAAKVEKEIGLASMTARERLIKFRELYPMLENLIPLTDIATYLGITNVSLSRLRKELMK